jgi:hypothetical protein
MQVILTSVAISGHLQQCAATAKIESRENVENSLLAVPDGESHVQPTVVVFKRDPWADFVTKQGGGKGDQETKEREEGGRKEGRGKNQEEGMGPKCKNGGMDDDSIDAGSAWTLLTSGALAALLSLNASKCRRGKISKNKLSGKVLDGQPRKQ